MTEAAVENGLRWIANQQNADGSWDFQLVGGATEDALGGEASAITGLALLAFQGAGNTIDSGEYSDAVSRGSKWLIENQKTNGEFPGRTLYTHGICLYAIADLYDLTRDPKLRLPLQRGIWFAVAAQNQKLGGWRYQPNRDSDTCVTGWFVGGLMTAKRASVRVPQPCLDAVSRYLQSAQVDGNWHYSYQPRLPKGSQGPSAIGVLCRQLLDDHSEPNATAPLVSRYPFQLSEHNYYYWFHATQAIRNAGGQPWQTWNRAMAEALCSTQRTDGPSAGSWPAESRFGGDRSAMYTTCLAVLTLEAYYRDRAPDRL